MSEVLLYITHYRSRRCYESQSCSWVPHEHHESSFRHSQAGGRRWVSGPNDGRTSHDFRHSRQIRAGFVSQFSCKRPVLGFGLNVGRTILHCRHSRQIGAGFDSQSSRRRPALIRRRRAHVLPALKASRVYPRKRPACTRFGLERAGRLSMNEKESIAHVIRCAIFAIGLRGSRFFVGASIGTTGATRFPYV